MKVLFVNHLQQNCGVFQYFKRLVMPVVNSNDNYYYIETNDEWEFNHWRDLLKPDIVIYNFYVSGATMGWLTNQKIAQQKGLFKQYSVYHEGNIDDKGFDVILHQDPTNIDPRYINLPRPIPEYTPKHIITDIPTIGTFGFGLGGKGFDKIIRAVQQEHTENVCIRMNIPYAYFGDKDGSGARWWANYCRELIKDTPNIHLEITHTLLPEIELLDFLAQNDINCFFYDDNAGRGISGTLDYALAAKKPIAITKSWQFKHMWDDDIIYHETENTLSEIIVRGIKPLEQYHQKWNTQTLIQAFERTFTV